MQRSAVLLCLVLLACGGKSTPEPPPPVASYPPLGTPIDGLTAGTWAWVDFPDSACDDGSPTGIGVNPGTGPDLLFFLNGGGACWDYVTCYTANLATHGPFGSAQLQALLAAQGPGSILDRGLAGHPLSDATLVLVPYCTGDIHGGDNVVTYVGADTRVHHHVGRRNVLAFLRRLAATFPAPRRLVVSGSSAGGFGALINYDAFRHYWPAASGFLVDDSGPPLGAGASPQLLQTLWFANWQLGKALDPICGTACRTDLSAQIPALSRAYPQDRLALLSSLQDYVISRYYLLTQAALQAELLRVTGDVIAPTANFRAFLVAGTSHTMLGDPAAFTQGLPLLDWLGQQVSGDAAWGTRQP